MSYGGKIPALGDRGWGVGLALQPFGGSIVKWPNDWAGRYRITEVDREVFSGTLTGGIEVIPQVRIGGGLVYYYTMETFKQHLWQEPFGATGVLTPGYPDATAKLGKLDGGALTYDVSFEVEPLKGVPFTFALDYKHKATQDLSGDVTWSGVSPLLGSPLITPANPLYPLKVATSTTSAKQTLTIPNTLNIGASYRVVKPVLVMATFTLDRWVVYDFDHFVGNTGFQLKVPRHYGNGQTYRAGVAWDVLPMLVLRAGLQRDVSGLKKELYSPTLPDASSWGGSLGATVKFAKAFSVDAGVFYAKMDKVTVPSSAVGSESPDRGADRHLPRVVRAQRVRLLAVRELAARRDVVRRTAPAQARSIGGRPRQGAASPFRVSGGPPPRRAASCREGSAGGRGVSMFPAWTTSRVRTSPCCRAGGPVRRAGRCGRASRAKRCG